MPALPHIWGLWIRAPVFSGLLLLLTSWTGWPVVTTTYVQVWWWGTVVLLHVDRIKTAVCWSCAGGVTLASVIACALYRSNHPPPQLGGWTVSFVAAGFVLGFVLFGLAAVCRCRNPHPEIAAPEVV